MKHHRPRQALTLCALACALLLAGPARAQDAVSSEKQELARLRATTEALIDALVSQGLLTRERADAILRQAREAGASAASAAATTAQAEPAPAQKIQRIPYVPETVRKQMSEEIKAEVLAQARGERWGEPGALPDWLGRITIAGDVRARAESDYFDSSNVPADIYHRQTTSPAWSPDLNNTTHTTERMTLRARLGVSAKLAEGLDATIRASTGNSSSGPTSTSQTLGNDFNKYSLVLDRAWISWRPWEALALQAGRMPSPFYNTDLSWADDLSFDGLAAQMKAAIRGEDNRVFATLGAFPLEYGSLGSSTSKWLLGAQIGAAARVTSGLQAKIGLAVYDFRKVEGVRETNPPPSGPLAGTQPYFASLYSPNWRQKGNTLIALNDPTSTAAPVWGLASKFRPVDLTVGLTMDSFAPVLVKLSADFIKNIAFDIADINQRAGVTLTQLYPKTRAAQLRLDVGAETIQRRGDWQAFTGWRYVERDAWVDGFTDTTWNLGGTNYKGWTLGLNYGIERNAWFGARWTSTRNLDDGVRFTDASGATAGTMSSAPLKIDVFQLELNARF
ncbi:putative porin [Pelomonas sp. KK5]|uniref:putative porin n=1 Tax=Pelomonas sp. KK5 TaxID=1855730 RepID=UPI00097C3DE7|nr:putative porin [Pelomonas sp. KK5]